MLSLIPPECTAAGTVITYDQRDENEAWKELCDNMFGNYDDITHERHNHIDIGLSVSSNVDEIRRLV
jgi:hypothetical protein